MDGCFINLEKLFTYLKGLSLFGISYKAVSPTNLLASSILFCPSMLSFFSQEKAKFPQVDGPPELDTFSSYRPVPFLLLLSGSIIEMILWTTSSFGGNFDVSTYKDFGQVSVGFVRLIIGDGSAPPGCSSSSWELR